jgi:cystathionine gamma-lyase
VHRDTATLNAGYRPVDAPGALLDGPQFSAFYVAPGDPLANAFTYGRFHNPTWSAWEEALSVLEDGQAVAFASGMAAAVAVLGVTLKPGDVLVLPSDSYYTTRAVATSWLQAMGVTVRSAPTRGNGQAALLDGARLLWLETPSNPGLDICDIRQLARQAEAKGIITVVDNTTATPYLQRPLQLGSTFVVSSDTKALTGHGDLILGHAATRSNDWATALRTWRTQHGAIPGPMEAWLAHRSLATLPLRLTRQCTTAERLARYLSSRRDVQAVHYPGLETHPGHAIAARQMDAFGGVVSFDLGTRPRAETFLQALTIVREATSFGSVHSTAERRARWGGDAISDGFIRFSVGCEAPEDILADVETALRAAVEAGS